MYAKEILMKRPLICLTIYLALFAACALGAQAAPRFVFHKGDKLTYQFSSDFSSSAGGQSMTGNLSGVATLQVLSVSKDGTAKIKMVTAGSGSFEGGGQSMPLSDGAPSGVLLTVKPNGVITQIQATNGKVTSAFGDVGGDLGSMDKLMNAGNIIKMQLIYSYTLFGVYLPSQTPALKGSWKGIWKQESFHMSFADFNSKQSSKTQRQMKNVPVTYTYLGNRDYHGVSCMAINCNLPDSSDLGGTQGVKQTIFFDAAKGRLAGIETKMNASQTAGQVTAKVVGTTSIVLDESGASAAAIGGGMPDFSGGLPEPKSFNEINAYPEPPQPQPAPKAKPAKPAKATKPVPAPAKPVLKPATPAVPAKPAVRPSAPTVPAVPHFIFKPGEVLVYEITYYEKAQPGTPQESETNLKGTVKLTTVSVGADGVAKLKLVTVGSGAGTLAGKTMLIKNGVPSVALLTVKPDGAITELQDGVGNKAQQVGNTVDTIDASYSLQMFIVGGTRLFGLQLPDKRPKEGDKWSETLAPGNAPELKPTSYAFLGTRKYRGTDYLAFVRSKPDIKSGTKVGDTIYFDDLQGRVVWAGEQISAPTSTSKMFIILQK